MFKQFVPYFERTPLETRLKDLEMHQKKFTNGSSIPVIVEYLPDYQIWKLVVPRELTFAQLLYRCRGRFHLKDSESIFAFIGKEALMSPSMSNLGLLYDTHKNADDDTLYIVLRKEATFG